MQTTVKTKKPRKQAISGCFWAKRTYRGRIKDDHKIDAICGCGYFLINIFCENGNVFLDHLIHSFWHEEMKLLNHTPRW